jgi:hypothetical protein
MDNKIIEFIEELKKGYPLSQLNELRSKLDNDEFYINVLELTINKLLTTKK